MKIIYRKKTLMTVCEIQLNKMSLTEPEDFEQVILESDEQVSTLNNIYSKKDLEIKK